MSISAELQRPTLIIAPGQLLSGSLRVPYRNGDDESLLRSYLVFVREVRGQRHARSVTLRSAEIATIADHLDISDDVVLGRLLDLMGVTRAQRKVLLGMLAAGALTIVATGSISGAALTDLGSADTQSPLEGIVTEVASPRAEAAVPAQAATVSLTWQRQPWSLKPPQVLIRRASSTQPLPPPTLQPSPRTGPAEQRHRHRHRRRRVHRRSHRPTGPAEQRHRHRHRRRRVHRRSHRPTASPERCRVRRR